MYNTIIIPKNPTNNFLTSDQWSELPNYLISLFKSLNCSNQLPDMFHTLHLVDTFLGFLLIYNSILPFLLFIFQICHLEFYIFWIWQAVSSRCCLTCSSVLLSLVNLWLGLGLIGFRFEIFPLRICHRWLWFTSCLLHYTRRHTAVSWQFSFCMLTLIMGLGIINLIHQLYSFSETIIF